MPKIIKLLLVLIIVVGAYLLGVYLPFCPGPRRLIVNTSMAQYYSNAFSLLEAIGTILAVVVALFHDDVIRIFKKPKFTICPSSKAADEETEDVKGVKKCKRYFNNIVIQNIGNVPAFDCDLRLENATYTDKSGIKSTLISSPILLRWIGERTSIFVPEDSKYTIKLFELFPGVIESTPSGDDAASTPCKISFMGLEAVVAKPGIMESEMRITSSNGRSFDYRISVEWDGVWEWRLTEMEPHINVSIKEI